MILDIVYLLVSLTVILISAEVFTNGVEWLGTKLGLGEGAVGSVLAAVGTALPETLIPLIAITFFGGSHGHDIGIGAIAGAPFMLSTLTLSLFGLSVFVFSRRGNRPPELNINHKIVSRDLRFFIVSYGIATAACLASSMPPIRWILAVGLVAIYGRYLYLTLKEDAPGGHPPEHLHLDRVFKSDARLGVVVTQVLMGIGGIILGAWFFVGHMEKLALAIGMQPIILSLIIAPVATELPEKVNSVLWARTGKDTLAMGNITGALVFQSCLPVAFAMATTEWNLSAQTIASALVAIGAGTLYWRLIESKKLNSFWLMLGFFAYAITITGIIMTTSHH